MVWGSGRLARTGIDCGVDCGYRHLGAKSLLCDVSLVLSLVGAVANMAGEIAYPWLTWRVGASLTMLLTALAG